MGLSQDDVAAVCSGRKPGTSDSRAAVAQWEKEDGTIPTMENLYAAAKLLNVSIDYLVGFSNCNLRPDLSEDALSLAELWDQMPPAVQESIIHAVEWASKQERNSKVNAIERLKRTIFHVVPTSEDDK